MSDDLQALVDAVEHGNGWIGKPLGPDAVIRPFLRQIARYWWVELLTGVLWVVIAAVVLKFNHASVVTVGVLTGVMFLLFAAEQFALAALDVRMRWLWVLFAAL